MESLDQARELFSRHHARYEVSPYFVVLDDRTFGVPETHRKIHAGFDVDVYGNGFASNSALDPHAALHDLRAASQVAVAQASESAAIEIIPGDGALILNVKSHLDPEALVRIRVTHTRGLGQPAGEAEEKAMAEVLKSLESLGVKPT